MALSRRHVLLASLVGFVAWGFAVRWVPILRFIGYAFIAGVAITAFFILTVVITTSRTKQDYDDASPEAPSLAFLSPVKWKAEATDYNSSTLYRSKPLYPQSFVISEALDELLNLAERDFISSWYGNISKSSAFVNEVDRGVRSALGNIRDRLLREDLVGIAVSRMAPIVTAHLREFDQAERAIRGKSLNRNVTESEELDLAVAGRYRDGKLHPAASLAFSDPKLVQQEYLRKLLVRILSDVLPENMIKSRAVSVLIKEIVACAVLYPVMQMLADPDTWNQLMEAYGRTALQDRTTVRKLRAALDEHASPAPKPRLGSALPKLAPNDSERSFERWVRAIRHCNNLSDARRFRSHVASQLKRESTVEGQDQTYLHRLETGKRVLDQKVAKLSAPGGLSNATVSKPDFHNGHVSRRRDTSLVEVMHNSSGLSYFMEYMDRQRLMSLVQFWVVVDGFRNPLEDDFGEDQSAHDGSVTWTDTDRTDIAQISEAYLSKAELKVPDESRNAVKVFLAAGKQATPSQYQRARSAILMAQSAALDEMQGRHYPNFKKSDLYYKYLTSDEASAMPQPPPERIVSPRADSVHVHQPRSQPQHMARTSSQPINKAKDLRRAAVSSSDIRASAKVFEEAATSRRSFDTDHSAPLFDDDDETDPLANSTYSIGKDSQNGDADTTNQNQVIESMEAALNDIITNEPKDETKDEKLEEYRSSLFGSPISSLKSGRDPDSPRSSLDFPRIEAVTGEKVKPSLATLGLVNTSSRIGVFSDDDLFGDEEKFIEDEYADPDEPGATDGPDEEIHEAAPGDLGLVEAISALTTDIERLVAQESVVDTLTRKAELTNNTAELRILSKSKSSLQREIRRKELQRQQYIVQESDNSLYGRSTVRIKSIMVGKEEDGREYALYLIEVQRKAGEQMPAASWAVARRYSEFHELNQRLRIRYPSVRNLEFPRRRMVMKLQKDFLHKRRIALEQYLRRLLLLPDVCRSRDLRSFLSQQAIISSTDSTREAQTTDIVTRIYNSVTDGMDDFLGNIAVLDQLSAAGQNLISAATSQLSTSQTGDVVVPDSSNPEMTVAEAEAELNAFEDRELEPFVKPICDLFLETFELNKGNNWLRGRAVVVVLHQLLGGTIERKVRDNARTLFFAQDAVLKYIALIKDTMWPNGKLREAKVRSAQEKAKSRTEASLMLATLVPDLAASVVGRANAQGAARRVFATMNNERLNSHLAFVLLDEVVAVLFGR